MRKPKSFLRVFTDTGPLAVLAVVIALLVGIVAPASAQFFNCLSQFSHHDWFTISCG